MTTELAPIEVGRIRITPLGLDLVDAGDVSYEELELACYVLGRMRDATAFGIGDAIIFGEGRFGEIAAQLAEATGRSPDTVTRFVRVAGSIWRSRRVPGLSWSHHELVARQKYSPDEQDDWLRRADEGRWSVGDLRSMLVEPKPIQGEVSVDSAHVAPGSTNGAASGKDPGDARDGGTASPAPIQQGNGVAGIDFSTYTVTIAVLGFDASVCDVREVRFRKATQSGTVEAYEAVKRLPRLLWDLDWSGVGVAWIERGYGKGRNADWALGRVQGAIAATLAGSFPVNEIAIQEWRKELTGLGQKPKEEMLVLQRKALAAAGVQVRQGPGREPVSPSYSGLSSDELDAVSIAVVGRAQNLRALETVS